MQTKQLDIYIAGPMRGYDRNNFDSFHKAASQWQKKSFIGLIYNPAEMDEDMGFSADSTDFSKEHLKACIDRDLQAILKCDALVMLSGWEHSEGARVEHALAVYLGLKIFYES